MHITTTIIQFILHICIESIYCIEWPSIFPELDIDILRDELCPWDTPNECFIFSKNKEIEHPVLNGMIDCDDKRFDKDLSIIRRHYGRSLYKYSSCEIEDIFRILCKPPPDAGDKGDKINEYIKESRFYFIQNKAISTARSSKSFNNLANRLTKSRLIFTTIGARLGGDIMSDFETLPKTLANYLDYFYKEMYISGSSWGMNRDKKRYNDIKQVLDLIIDRDYELIINEGKQIYFKAFDCNNYIECKPNNLNILYYNKLNDKLKFQIEIEVPCLNRLFDCNRNRFEKKQSLITTWSPANFAFIEIESGFRIKFADHWIKNEMNPNPIPNEYLPKETSLKTKQFLNNGMEIKSTSIITPFEWKLNSQFKSSFYSNTKTKKRGFISYASENLESKQRIKFQGQVTKTTIFHIRGKKERNLQIKKKIGNDDIILPIFPPLSEIEITWMLYNWRFCWIKDFGADKPLKLYSEPPDIIEFSELIQDLSNGLWSMTIMSSLHNNKIEMASYSQIRLYPNCGDPIGKTEDDKDPCQYIYFYDVTRIDDNEIQQWDGDKFAPKIDEEFKYLLLKYDKKKEFKLGIIVNPSLGTDAIININFNLETNDWKNIYILPSNTKIETKLLFSDNNNAPFTLIAPKLKSENIQNPIQMGSPYCFKIKLKSKSESISRLQFKDRIYFRPIIFPTKNTIKKWDKDGYQYDNICTAGFTLLTINEENKNSIEPGLMHFTFKDSKLDIIEFGSFCIYFKLYGEYNIYYEIGSKYWYSRDSKLISFDKTLEALIKGPQDEAIMNQQIDKLKKLDINKCYENKDGFYSSIQAKTKYFLQKSYLMTRTRFSGKTREYIKVEKPGAVSFEIREFPQPLKIGSTTKWITIHVSRAPLNGKFILKPICKTESKLKFEFEGNIKDFYELEPVNKFQIDDENADIKYKSDSTGNIEPFSFKMRIIAPKDLQCYGHYPYKIDWKVKQIIVDPKNDNINNPPSIFLMVIANDFDKLDTQINTNQENVATNTYDDGMADPKCIEKYTQRKEDEQDLGSKGPNGQLAPPLNNMGKKMDSGHMAAAGDNYDAQEFLKPVTVSDTIHSPAQLADYLKDYDRLKRYICNNQPQHELCGGNITSQSVLDKNSPTIAPTIPLPPPLPFWAWQNCVVYVASIIIIIGLIKAFGCFEKSLETRIIEAQIRAIQPLNNISNDN